MSERADIIVVGGGPAGSTLAWQLRKAGMDVLILDKAEFPRDKVCAGWITPAVVESLELDSKDYARGRVFQPISGFRISRQGDSEAITEYAETVSYGIRRREFDHYLLQRANVRVLNGESVKSIVRDPQGLWNINGRFQAPLLVGAGGHFCPVARHLGNKTGSGESVVAAQEIEFAMSPAQQATCQVSGQQPELFFCPDLQGYAWVFRKGDYLNIGLGREDNHRLADHVSGFVQFLKARGRIPQDIPERFHGHAYLLYGHTPRTSVADGVLLIGDALGLAYPQSGEGIRPAIESALLAAKVIKEAGGEYRQENLKIYTDRLISRFGPMKADDVSAGWLPAPLKHYLAGKLIGNRWFARHVVMDRWFLHRDTATLHAD